MSRAETEVIMVDNQTVRKLLRAKRIAVVGLSDQPFRPAYGVSQYMQAHGYEIIPVHPRAKEALGAAAVKTLAEIEGPIDLVNVFRRGDACDAVAQEAIAAGAGGIWLQLGIHNPRAKELADAAGVPYVEDRCIMVEHMRYGGNP